MRSEWFQAFVKTVAVVALVLVAALAITWLVAPERLGNPGKARAQRVSCINNLKQIGLAFRQWAIDHGDQYPFNVSTNMGGTMEFRSVDKGGFDLNPVFHFQVLSNELNASVLVVCPKDKSKIPSFNFATIEAKNVTYQLRSGMNLSFASREVLLVCPIDGNILYGDATVKEARK